MARTIQHKRGLERNLPTLKPGELAFTTDTKKVFIGSDTGNVDITNSVDVSKLATKIELNSVTSAIAERPTKEYIDTQVRTIPKGDKGDKGDPGNATLAIDDNVTNSSQTWSGRKINERLSSVLSKPRMTNKLENANFSVAFNVNTGWQTTLSTYTLDTTNHLVKLTPTARLGQLTQTQALISGHKYYAATKVKASNTNVRFNVYYNAASSNLLEVYHPGSNAFELLSGVFTATASGNVSFRVIDFRTAGWDEISVKEGILVDLTAMFGEGKEPTKADFESLLANNFVNGFFEHTQEINTFLGDVFGKVAKASVATVAEQLKDEGLLVKFDKETGNVQMCYRISPTKTGKTVISKTGSNNIMMLKQFEYKTSSEFDYFENADMVIGGTTDWISPITMWAKENGDGTQTYVTTGGNHLMNGGITAWTKSINVLFDGKVALNSVPRQFAREVIVKVRNQIVASNTYSLNRPVLDEYVTYIMKDGILYVEVCLIPIEDIIVHNYYGLQFTSPLGTYFNEIQYVGSLNKEFNNTVADQTNPGKITEELLDTFILKGSGLQFTCFVDRTYGLGTREYTTPTEHTSFRIGGIKLYSELIRKTTTLSARKPYFWKGSYQMKGVS